MDDHSIAHDQRPITWVSNHTRGSILLAMLLHASGNAASMWLGAVLQQAALHEPQQGIAAALIRTGWLNVIAYGLVASILAVLTQRRFGYRDGSATPDRGDAVVQPAPLAGKGR